MARNPAGLCHSCHLGRRRRRHHPVDLAAITADTLRTLGDHNLTIETALEPAETEGDRNLVERLVANLIDNAVRHNQPHGQIAVTTRTDRGRALLIVTNTGPLIPPDELTRLFQPFQRLENQRTNARSGLGLGLSIVEAIATAHNATFTAHAQPGGGLHIQVSFPARP